VRSSIVLCSAPGATICCDGGVVQREIQRCSGHVQVTEDPEHVKPHTGLHPR
jgi:hypothetical protein